MSTPTDVVPEAGWYRDPASPGVARWWDGTSWGTQTQAVPSEPALPAQPEPQPGPLAAEATATEAAPLIGVAATTLTAEPAGRTPKGRISEALDAQPEPATQADPHRDRRCRPDRRRLVRVVLDALLVRRRAGHPAVRRRQLRRSTRPPCTCPRPFPQSSPVRAGRPARSRSSAAKGIAAAQRPVTRVHLAAYYGPSVANRFLFVGSTLSAAQAKPVSATVERAQLVGLLNAETGGSLKAAKVELVRVPAGTEAGGGVLSCVSATSHGKPASVCSWQNATTKLTVVTHTPVLGAATTLRTAIAQLAG